MTRAAHAAVKKPSVNCSDSWRPLMAWASKLVSLKERAREQGRVLMINTWTKIGWTEGQGRADLLERADSSA